MSQGFHVKGEFKSNLNIIYHMGVNKRVVNFAVKVELWRCPVGITCMLQAFEYWYHIQSSKRGPNAILKS